MKDKIKYIEIAVAVVLCIGAVVFGMIIGNKDEDTDNNKNKYEEAIFVDAEAFDGEKESIGKIVVEIKGEIKKPDVYTLDEGKILKDLIELAGGITEEGDISNINRARKLVNNECVVVSKKGEVVASGEGSSGVLNSGSVSNGLVNINTATVSELDALPDIGPSRAEAIIKYREKSGGFKSVEEIKNISGIGEKSFEKLKERICV